ncbi:transporter substrate-binding domain-containing protein [Candidatus Dependentiae bacterium]|nr:transporter substrate-binding domain-containing protein [Candidatus Dependentiae bacterium]
MEKCKKIKINNFIFYFIFCCAFIPALSYNAVSKPVIEFSQEEMNYISSKQKIIVLCDYYFPPFIFEDAVTKQIKGFSVDIIKAISEKTGLEVVFKSMRWEKVIPALLNKDGDIIAGIILTPERNQILDFSTPYLFSSRNIFVQKGNPKKILTINDLKFKKIAVQKSDVCENVIKNINGANIIFTDNQKDGILYLNNKLIDAFVGNKFLGIYLIKSLKITNIDMIEGNIAASDYCIGMNKGNEVLKNIINKTLNILKMSDEYDEIYNKWFSLSEINEKMNVQYKQIILIVLLILFIFFILLVISLTWIYVLKKAIKYQTKKINLSRNELIEQNRKIIESNEQLKKLDSMKDNFVSNVSHELRTPLVSILGYVNLLEEKKLGDLSEKQIKAINIIAKNINKLLTIINSLLDITRSEEKLFKDKREYVDLVKMIENSIALYEPMIKSRNIKVSFDYDKSAKYVFESHMQLVEIIINNLITNAIKYNKNEGSIFIELTKNEKTIILSVKDTGIGIDKIHFPKIFDRFYQIDNKITSNSGGFGIGLYLIKKYATILKSSIELESEIGKGSEFKIIFNINGENYDER